MAKQNLSDETLKLNIVINGNEAQKKLMDLEKVQRELNKENKLLLAQKAKLKAFNKTESKEYKELTQRIKENEAALKANKLEIDATTKKIGIKNLTMAQLNKRAKDLRYQLNNLYPPGTAGYKKYTAELQAVNTRLAELRGQSRA
ncbi:MAG: hypothetical protein LAT81_14275, partial [Oceanicaulis sp.]|nr:hypothetical protein [Oceanicaulis sp.]